MRREGDRDTMVMWSAWELTSNFSKAPMDSTDITVPDTPRITCSNAERGHPLERQNFAQHG